MRDIIRKEVRKVIDKAIDLRHRFHEIPECSFKENKTSHLIVQCIYTGPNGTIDPPEADGNPTGDDVLLVANSGLNFAVVGEGFPNFPEFGITPDGHFSDKFIYSITLSTMRVGCW